MVSGGVPTRFSMANTLPKLKKSSSSRISSQRKKIFAFTSTRTESHEANAIVTVK